MGRNVFEKAALAIGVLLLVGRLVPLISPGGAYVSVARNLSSAMHGFWPTNSIQNTAVSQELKYACFNMLDMLRGSPERSGVPFVCERVVKQDFDFRPTG